MCPSKRINPSVMSFDYWLPLSPSVLLHIGRDPGIDSKGGQADAYGARECRDFSAWETAWARHLVSATASRFLYGSGPYVSRSCAASCISRVDRARVEAAVAYGGFDPRPPSFG